MKTQRYSVVCLLLLGFVAGCLDFQEITALPGSDAAVESSTVTDAGPGSACVSCAAGTQADAGPGCASAYAACESTGKCGALFLCGAQTACFAPGVSLISCITGCAEMTGVTSATDPAIGPFTTLYSCVEHACSTACAAP
jgi:hypothetical protein